MSKFKPPLQPAFQPPAMAAGPGPPAALPLVAQNRNGMLVMLLGSYALMCTVPIAELLITHVGIHIPVVVIAQVLLTLGLMSVGRIGEFWKTPIAKPYIALLALFAIAGLFGDYPSRSLGLIFPYAIRIYVLPFYCCAIAMTTKQVRQVFSWLGGGAFLLLLLCFVYGKMAEDRFIIPDSTLQNPNDLGFAILFVMSGLLVLQSKVSRLMVAVSLPMFFVYLMKTGSRADMITLIVLTAAAFWFAPRSWKMILLLASPLVAAGIAVVVPAETLARLATIVVSPRNVRTSNNELNNALDSQAARMELQQRAISLAMRHPVLGVGANNFADAVDEMVESTLHEKSGWQAAHNTYLQIAAENGVPALCFYCWTVFLCLKMNLGSYRICRATPQLSGALTQSFALLLMTLMYTVCTAFSNNSFDPHYNVLVGLTAANYLAVQRELRAARQDPASPAGLTQPQRNQAAPARLRVAAPRSASGEFPLPERLPVRRSRPV